MATEQQHTDAAPDTGEQVPEEQIKIPPRTFQNDTETIRRVLDQLTAAS